MEGGEPDTRGHRGPDGNLNNSSCPLRDTPFSIFVWDILSRGEPGVGQENTSFVRFPVAKGDGTGSM